MGLRIKVALEEAMELLLPDETTQHREAQPIRFQSHGTIEITEWDVKSSVIRGGVCTTYILIDTHRELVGSIEPI